MEALQMAVEQATEEEMSHLIHHSDRGVQYCCNEYIKALQKHQISISMTEDYKPTDNAIAERVNGILKTEVIYRERRFKSIEDASERISSFIRFYNEDRPHRSIGYKVPAEAHNEEGPQSRMWR
ncbi:MAG: integrase core domain-containing protein [Bacteroidaceae bacterium]|nr:integrase core domain-containing protein [Bacteroidaceae bacterium]